MPSPLIKTPNLRSRTARRRIAALLFACGGIGGVLVSGCYAAHRGAGAREASRFYPPQPQTPRVVALGTLRGAPAPSKAEVELALFFFGAEPAPPLTIANPAGLAARDDELLICDSALGAIFRWDARTQQVAEFPIHPHVPDPVAIDIAPTRERFICTRHAAVRTDAAGNVMCTYALPGDPSRASNGPVDQKFKPAGVLAVGQHVWVTNQAAQHIEVFDAQSGAHVRAIGTDGRGPAQFAFPRGLARTPDGNVCVVDMLNNRVQVLTPDGTWLRDIGQPGDNVGCFGRPKDVAVGPDRTIFVTDTFSQRVHAFAPDGQPLLAFGEPGSGPGELTLPSGIAVSAHAPATDQPLPRDLTAAYYVLVAEQLNRPGVRVYAWLADGRGEAGLPLPAEEARDWRPHFPESVTINPHWDAERCTSCHTAEGQRLLPIAPEAVDALCLSCHDGVKAFADPHPIGRPAVTESVKTPEAWPTVAGMIGCLTCHDIQRHCRVDARRPAVNTVLLRAYDPQRPLEYCTTCHSADVGGRFSPHRQRDATGRVREDACFFCHTQRPDVPADGRRRFEPHLRVTSSELCLNCHSKHWDLSRLGHVDRLVTPAIRQWMLMRELSLTVNGDRRQLAELAQDPNRHPARLPLGDNRVTCYTCHNPHYAGLFPPDSELGALAHNPQDRASALRTDWIDLCSQCHHH